MLTIVELVLIKSQLLVVLNLSSFGGGERTTFNANGSLFSILSSFPALSGAKLAAKAERPEISTHTEFLQLI